ncbi:MAG: NUDIX hydrolase [Eubacteriales bacterium]|nr:NUDIX hydrolase [Eubacteriales bacterium]
MKKLNCIVVFDKEKEKILFCKRMKDPYKGLYNFVGGKVEEKETDLEAAYRELSEETGITNQEIELFPLMDFTYYQQDFILQIYVGKLQNEVTLVEEKNPLIWLTLDEDFCNPKRFAGDRNIGHIVNVALKYLL